MTCSTSEWRHQAGSRSTFRQRARSNFHCLRFARKEMGDSRCMHTRGVVSGDDDTYTSLYVISSRLQRTRIRRPPVKSAAIQTPLGDTSCTTSSPSGKLLLSTQANGKLRSMIVSVALWFRSEISLPYPFSMAAQQLDFITDHSAAIEMNTQRVRQSS